VARIANFGSHLNTRPACQKDFDELFFIEEQAHSHPWSESTLYWSLSQPNFRCFVLQQERDILGFSIYECVLDEATLLNIAIHPLHQGKGLGKQLLQQSLCQLDNAIKTVFLEVRASNIAALHLYQQEGFLEIGLRKNYYPTDFGREDAKVFSLNLDTYSPLAMLRKG
jgi:ribosomal-protein-alanine N-acetyltransferase